MPRRKTVSFAREIPPDLRFNSVLVQRFINTLMERGKKSVARSIVYGAIEAVGKKSGGDIKKGFEVFERALDQIRPIVEVKSRRVGGGVYQVPVEVRSDRAMALAFRWLIEAAASRNDKTMSKRLASEMLEAIEGRGNAIKKRTDVHKMAESNRAFAHYAW